MIVFEIDDKLDFGHLPPAVDHLLQQGVAAHFSHPDLAENAFLTALALAPEALATHRCLVKHYNRYRQFDKALSAARNRDRAAGKHCRKACSDVAPLTRVCAFVQVLCDISAASSAQNAPFAASAARYN